MRSLFLRLCALATVAAACGAGACSAVSGDGRIGVEAPSEDQFQADGVAQYLNFRCGSLDCHGQMVRNLRIWGCEGMRLDPNTIPGCGPPPVGGGGSTDAEVSATYRSLVGLEPAVMSAVVAGHGAHPELLTFVRKARGWEAHKGGALIVPGDDQDVCITSWLAGSTDRHSCVSALAVPTFPAVPAADASTK